MMAENMGAIAEGAGCDSGAVVGRDRWHSAHHLCISVCCAWMAVRARGQSRVSRRFMAPRQYRNHRNKQRKSTEQGTKDWGRSPLSLS